MEALCARYVIGGSAATELVRKGRKVSPVSTSEPPGLTFWATFARK